MQEQREFPARPGTSAAGTGPQAACPATERLEGREAARSAALEYAEELEELSANSLHKIKWKPP